MNYRLALSIVVGPVVSVVWGQAIEGPDHNQNEHLRLRVRGGGADEREPPDTSTPLDDYGNPMALDDGEPSPNPERTRRLSGRVIVSRKTPARLQAEGRGPAEIAAIRSQGMAEIRKKQVIYESLGEGDFQVVEVGVGNEAAFIRGIANNPVKAGLFQFIEPDYMEYLVQTTPNDPLLNNQWHHAIMQSWDAWDLETGPPTGSPSPDVTVGICDTGIQIDHPDLAANMLEGYNAETQMWGGDITATGNHGTLCAGCAAAIGDNGVGIAGMGWSFKHRPGRVTTQSDPDTAPSAWLADCARKMCEKSDVKVVSVSFSGVDSLSRRQAATYCKTQGSLMVNSAGNDNRDITGYDPDADDLIVVGATDEWDGKTYFSAYGGYAYVGGTSFSGPLTAGLIALVWSANLGLNPDQVEQIIKDSADDLGEPGVDTLYRYGRINAHKAILRTMPCSAPADCMPQSTPDCFVSAACNPIDPAADARGCVVTLNPNCCGNGICETSDGGACPADCEGPLVTTWAAGNGQAGNFFKVEALHDLTITGFDIHADSAGSGTVNVYQMARAYRTNDFNSPGAWGDPAQSISSNFGGGRVTLPDLPGPGVFMKAGTTRSFYIITSRNIGLRYTNGSQENNVFKQNAHLIFYEGRGSGGSFSSTTYVPRVWNGDIRYRVPAITSGTPVPTANPTLSPTTNPTSSPSKSPTGPPSPPTGSPSQSPSAQPTGSPTAPTKSPTAAPTGSPIDPKNSPTKSPSAQPTKQPTKKPSEPCVPAHVPPANCDQSTICCSGIGNCHRNGRWANYCK